MPSLERLVEAGLPDPALGLVGDQDHRGSRSARAKREVPVEGRDPGAGVDQEQRHIRIRQRPFGLAAHPRLKAVVERLL